MVPDNDNKFDGMKGLDSF